MINKIFYRGFVELNDNKKAKTSYKKDKPLFTYEQMQEKENFAGVLSDDTILVDIDDEDTSLKLKTILNDLNVNCQIVKTTRGRHFLFKNTSVDKCYTHTYLAIGLVADIKVGIKNSYEVLKYHNNERVIEQELDTSKPYDLPYYLIPVSSAPEFLHMQEGDGRNQNMFNYILTLQKYKLTMDEIRYTLTLINKYVLPSPLSENELNQIMREEAFEKPSFYDGKRFMHEVFGDFLQNKYHIKRINGSLHVYMDNVYIPDNKNIEYLMLLHIKELTKLKRSEVLSYISIMCKDNTQMSPANLILFKNGVYDITTGEFLEPNPSFIITNQIPHNYNPNAKSKIVDEVLDNLANGHPNNRLLIEEMIGFCMYRRSEDGRCFILRGKEANGKSTLLSALTVLLGNENTSALDLKDIDDQFSTIMLQDKLANIGDDISDEYISSTGKFKKVVTGDRITAEHKGVDKIAFDPYCKLIFSANNIPRIGRGKDAQAIARRMVIVPLTAVFKKDNVISENGAEFKPYIIDELTTEESMEYLILLALKGLKRWIDKNEFTMGSDVVDAINEFKHDNNPMLGFFEELEADGLEESINDKTDKEIYTRYCNYCDVNKNGPLGINWVIKQLTAYFPDYEKVRRSKRNGDSIEKVNVIVKVRP